MPRKCEEWVGATPDTKVPDRIKLRIWRAQNGICGLSNTPINPGDPKHLHHRIALILGGLHSESNLVWVHAKLNAEEAKSEVALKAANDARAKAHAGIKSDGKTALAGRSDELKKAAKAPKKPPLEPRRLYRDAS